MWTKLGRSLGVVWLAALPAASLPQPARGQGFDCAKARSPVERAICAQPALRTLDRAVADAYAAALARPGEAASLRQDQLRWLRARDAACNLPAAQLPACLSQQMNARLAALAPAQPAPQQQAGARPAQGQVQEQAQGQQVAGQPAPPTPPAPVDLPDPAIPAFVPPAPAATLDTAALPATAEGSTLLRVTSPGRFAIAARSATGVALQLVDQLVGPSDPTGEAGVRDGRLDVLLDVGTYKLRTLPAPGTQPAATGDVQLQVTPFRDAAPPRATPAPGRTLSATLADGEQRGYWILVGPDETTRIDAAGRSLADLRLWRNGTDLDPLQPVVQTTEPTRGHPLGSLRLSGKLEPGAYLLVAYGGPALPWADGATAQPFHLRAAPGDALAEGWAGGTVGPLGSEVFRTPAWVDRIRLALPAPPPAASPVVLAADGQEATVAANTRDPSATLRSGPNSTLVELRGAEGQPYRLRAAESAGASTWGRSGTWWVGASMLGTGGDEVPPTVLLSRAERLQPTRVVGSNLPRIAGAQSWRARFNLRGPTSLLYEVLIPGEVGFRNVGDSPNQLRIDPGSGEVPAGVRGLLVAPEPGKQGVADLVIGPPGSGAPPAPTLLPADPVIPLGVQTLDPGQRLELFANRGPGVQAGLVVRGLPVALASAPLVLLQPAGGSMEVPVALSPGGTLAASEIGVGDIPVGFRRDAAPVIPIRPAGGPDGGANQDAATNGIAVLPATDRPRLVSLAWRRPLPRPAVTLPGPADAAPLAAGTPRWLDLGRGERRSLALDVAEGGLYRVETLGRLRTAGSIATRFVAELDRAEANGAGQNMLVQRWLRAGRYRVQVSAQDSQGRLGITARPAPMLDGATLEPEGSVRARLPAGTGIAFPLQVSQPGRYRLELLGLGRRFTARLDDAEGWPLVAPGPLSSLERDLQPGRYRLVVQPEATDARLVARLSRIEAPKPPEGHGPHPLPFEAEQRATWREPPGRDDPRTPDGWRFALYGSAKATLRLSDGMVAELVREDAGDAGPGAKPVARILGKVGWTGTLEAGRYRLDAASLGRNDRLDYTLRLSTEELQPGPPRDWAVPGTVPFAIAEERVVSLTSFGTLPLKAVLRDDAGQEVARFVGRSVAGAVGGADAGDWNLAVSRLLPAGRYRLEVAELVPPDAVATRDTPPPTDTSDEASSSSEESEPDEAEPAAQSRSSRRSSGTPAATDSAETGADGDRAEAAEAGGEGDSPKRVQVRLALPAMGDAQPAPNLNVPQGTGGVQRLAVAQPTPGRLLVATGRSVADLALSLERRDEVGRWRTVAFAQGAAPVAAAPSDGEPAPWRVSAWLVDGGTQEFRLDVAALDLPAQPPGRVTLSRLGAGAQPLAAARVGLDAPSLVALTAPAPDGSAPASPAPGGSGSSPSGVPTGLLVGGWPGHALAAPEGTLAVPQSAELWLLAPRAGGLDVSPLRAAPGVAVAVPVPAGGSAALPAPPPADGRLRAWLADAGLEQPGLDAGAGMGVAPGSAFAMGPRGQAAPARVWNAGGPDVLRPQVIALDLAALPARALDAPISALLPPRSALPVRLPEGDRTARLALAPGTAAVLGWQDRDAVTVWSGGTALARTVDGGWTDALLVNTSSYPQPVALSWTPAPASAALRPGQVSRRFFGAAGSFELAVEGRPGASLVVAGGDGAVTGGDGRVLRGRRIPVGGPARAVVSHQAGLVALWLEADGASPWPQAEPRPVPLPSRMAMEGAAMALALQPGNPVLLHARTSAPVILTLGNDAPAIYPAGAELNRYLAGDAVLRVDSPHDGPLSGTLELTAEPVLPMREGLGEPVAVAPGNTAVFGFTLARATEVGVGVRAEPDRAEVRVLDAAGTPVGEGVSLLRRLPAGRYLVEARIPPDAPATLLRPALVGATPRPSGPPPEVTRKYLELVGLGPTQGVGPGPKEMQQ